MDIISFSVDWSKPEISFATDWLVLGPFLILIVGLALFRWYRRKNLQPNWQTEEVTVTVKTGVIDYENKIVRSSENVEIAHKIYIELITRKAALPFDKDNDVIAEVYNSWYSLFQVVRNEIKGLPSQFVANSGASSELITLTVDILNKGLRPHLTKYQAAFRKWYDAEIDKKENSELSRQMVQRNYPDYEELISNLLEVNKTLEKYSKELLRLINGPK
ncbi:MAG: hypothetical protein GC178_00725 [Flavobacteriales bacterium]|nr:hypothetical protein [Flavobacteriales bacterium]